MQQFQLPYHLIVEEGVFSRLDQVMKDCIPDIKKRKAILVTDANLKDIFANVIRDIQGDLKHCEVYLVSDGSFDTAVALAKHICVEDINLVIGLGGGSVLDLAKYAAFVSKRLFLCLPTTLSNDGIASPHAVLGTEGRARKTFGCGIPAAVIVDANVILTAPKHQLLSGIGDTVSKYTALNDWKLAAQKNHSTMEDFAYMMSKMAFNSICYNVNKEIYSKDFIKMLTHALVMGGLAMEIAGSSRPSSGSEHLFCHALEECYADQVSLPHGIAVAVGSYGACVFQNRNLAKITKMLKDYEIPVCPSKLGISKEVFIGAWQKAAGTRADRYTILNETDLSDERLGKLYDQMEEEFGA